MPLPNDPHECYLCTALCAGFRSSQHQLARRKHSTHLLKRGVVRAEMELRGKVLSTLDMSIAAHAHSVDAILVTNDGAFGHVADLHLEDWTIDASR